ncbi:MAG: dihydroorotase [Lachnospiraceae bacterium]|nr:dihydroorotase [Lachnospiraceae bacterium]
MVQGYSISIPAIPGSPSFSPLVSEEMLSSLSKDSEYTFFPGFCDVHVHFREPGFSYKETIRTGSQAAAAGGYTAVCTMPNLNPVPDSADHLNVELSIIKSDAAINIYPYGSITVNEEGKLLSDMEGMAESAIAFSDDGKGVQDVDMMREAMLKAKSLSKMIVAHCEDNSFLPDKKSEWKEIERDLKLADETKVSFHVCHISCKESVELIRDAKASGVDVTCETAPHYLLLNDSAVSDDGRFKMNPPIGNKKDQDALLEGLTDGTIDMVATDHAPHSAEEKPKSFKLSASGIVGIETAFPLLYTYLVNKNIITLSRLITLLTVNPKKRFNIPFTNDFSVWNLNESYEITPSSFLSKGRSTPFTGWKVYGRCIETQCNGKKVYSFI